jgi:hypothetical protein
MFQYSFSRIEKKACKFLINSYLQALQSTQSRSRTGTGVTPLVFETNASTDSAIWASSGNGTAKVASESLNASFL